MAYNTLEKKEYFELVKRFKSKDRTFIESQFGNTRSVSYNRMTIAKTNLIEWSNNIDDYKFNLFIRQFNKRLIKAFLKNDYLFDLKIENTGKPFSEKNTNKFTELSTGEDLYEFDIKSAYWQIAHSLGYIDTKLFEKYLKEDEYKMAKRVCFSFLAREKKVIFHNSQDSFEIKCENDLFRNVYDNVRIKLNCTIHHLLQQCDSYYKYNTDAIFVDLSNCYNVSKGLKKLGLQYNYRVWEKINEKEIKNRGIIKKF